MGLFSKLMPGDDGEGKRLVERDQIKLKAAKFNLNDTLKDVANILTQEALAKKISIIYRIDKNVPSIIIGDRYKIATVLTSLIRNAIDFTEKKRDVTVTIRRNVDNKDALELHFEVIDQGIGIADDAVNTIIMPFLRSDQPASSFGIEGEGLERSRDIIHAMFGSIAMECHDAKGCRVKFHLLISAPDLNEKRHYRLPSKAGVGLKTLIIDDDHGSANALKGMLEYFRHNVSVSRTTQFKGFEAYDMVIVSARFYTPDAEAYLLDLKKDHSVKVILIENLLQQRQDDSDALHATDWLIYKPYTQQFVYDMLAALYPAKGDAKQSTPAAEKSDNEASAETKEINVEETLSSNVDSFLTRGVIDANESSKMTKCRQSAHQFFVAADGLNECDNDYADFTERLKEVLWKYVKADRVIQRAYADGDCRKMGEYCHEMKSTLSKLGIYKISCLCDLLEDACKNNRKKDIQALANASTYVMAQTITAIDQFLEQAKFRKR